ncbi:MAG: GNAT family N-acetyltransferase [Oscillospiraceae bacterium]|nr:GNAT family N-acetyltransferase [Oscillospiraceae bacterium]
MEIEKLFKTDPALYADMESFLRSGEWRIEYESPTALALHWKHEWLRAIAAFEPEEARRLLAGIPADGVIVLRGCEGLRELAAERGFGGVNPCRQAVYEKRELVHVGTELTIRHPDGSDFPKIRDSYDLGLDEEVREAFERPDFLGGYLDGELVGYIGVHGEGSMGMLHVFEPYRRRGYAEAIYGTLINDQLRKGRVPYAQIIEDNAASLALQRKLGLRISDGLLYWMWREPDAE